NDGVFIHIPEGCVVEEPIFLLFLSGSNEKLLINQPRNIIVAEENSQVKIIEYYSGISDNIYFTNVVNEVVIGENSVVDLYKIQNENLNSFHISKTQVELNANSSFTSSLISFGGALVRNDLNSVLNGEGCECNYNGLFIVNGGQHIDNHTLMDHAKPHCQSNELYKGILGGKSRGVFNGKVIVRKNAQKTNAYQSNKNIILSNEALMNTKPQLEIFADDVKCSHGATVGQLDDDSVFYLRSRGIDEKNARSMLISAFASDVIDLIKLEPLREEMNKIISKQLNEMEHN
ncbi:MAG: Fe-S cluster assembly protein SufD, partial [Ignavibacteria bacterium]